MTVQPGYEHDLICGFLAGDREAHRVIARWIETILNLRSWHWTIRAGREDIMQEVLLALTGNLREGKYRGQGLKTYVSSMTKFNCLRVYDRHSSDSRREDAAEVAGRTPFEELVKTEELAAIQRAITALSYRCRRMLVLRYRKNLDHNEIARILAIRPTASRQWLKRCLDRLRKALGTDNKL